MVFAFVAAIVDAHCEVGEYANDDNVCALCPAGTFGEERGLLRATCSGECEGAPHILIVLL